MCKHTNNNPPPPPPAHKEKPSLSHIQREFLRLSIQQYINEKQLEWTNAHTNKKSFNIHNCQNYVLTV